VRSEGIGEQERGRGIGKGEERREEDGMRKRPGEEGRGWEMWERAAEEVRGTSHQNRLVGAACQGRREGSQTYWGYDLDLSRSRDVVDHVTIRFTICQIVLVVHWNRASVSNRFRDI